MSLRLSAHVAIGFSSLNALIAILQPPRGTKHILVTSPNAQLQQIGGRNRRRASPTRSVPHFLDCNACLTVGGRLRIRLT